MGQKTQRWTANKKQKAEIETRVEKILALKRKITKRMSPRLKQK
jgi:hypothetical protein